MSYKRQKYYRNALKCRDAFFACNKSVEQFCQEANLRRANFNNLLRESYNNSFALDTLSKFASCCGVSLSEILENENKAECVEDKRELKKEMKKEGAYGDIFTSWLKFTGMSTRAVSRNAGVSEELFRDIRFGRTKHPREKTLEKIAKGFGLTLNEFLAGAPDAQEIILPPKPSESESIKQDDECAPGSLSYDWIKEILKWQIQDAHEKSKTTSKPADRKQWASIIDICAQRYKELDGGEGKQPA